MFTLVPSINAIATHRFAKDHVALSNDLKLHLTNIVSNAQKYLKKSSGKTSMFDINEDGSISEIDSSKYYALDVNNTYKLFEDVPAVLSDLPYFFDSAATTINRIKENILNGISGYVSVIDPKGDGEFIDVSSIAYYAGAAGMLSNTFIPMTNVRNATFEILSIANDAGDLIRNKISGIFLFTEEAIDSESATGIKKNKHASSNGSTTTYGKFIEAISDLPCKDAITIRKSTPLPLNDSDGKRTKVGEYKQDGSFELTNFQSVLSVVELSNVENAYLSGINAIRTNRSALFRDDRMDNPSTVNVVYHDGFKNRKFQDVAIEVNTYSSYSISSYEEVFPDIETLYPGLSSRFEGWTRIRNSKEVTDSKNSEIIVQNKQIDLWPVGIQLLDLTYNTNKNSFLSSGQISTPEKNVFEVFPNSEHTVKEFGILTETSSDYENYGLQYLNGEVSAVLCSYFTGYSLNRNSSKGNIDIGDSIEISTENVVLYPIYEFSKTIDVSCSNSNYFGIKYCDNLSTDFRCTYYGLNSISDDIPGTGKDSLTAAWDDEDWQNNAVQTEMPSEDTPNIVPGIKWLNLSIDLSNHFGDLYKDISKVKIAIGGYLNEVACIHSPDSIFGGYCKLLANVYKKEDDSSLTLLNNEPMFLWEYSSIDASISTKHSKECSLDLPITNDAIEAFPKDDDWFYTNGAKELSIQLVLSVDVKMTKREFLDPRYRTSWTGTVGFVDVCGISAKI